MRQDSHQELTFKTQTETKATVDRKEEKSERATKGNLMLTDIGAMLKPEEGCEYLGSAAVHLYIKKGSALLVADDEALFMTQTTPMQRAPSNLANAAAVQLNRQLQQMFTGKMQTKRSGL